MKRKLQDFADPTKIIDIQEGYELETIHKKLSGIIESGEINNFQEGGLMISIHTLCSEVVRLQEEVKQLKQNK
jgi:hypothetical protein